MFLPFWQPCTVTEANTLHLCKRLGYNYSWQAASCSKWFACDSLGLHAKRKRRLHRDIKARDVKWLQYRPGRSFKTNSAGLCGYSKASKSYFCFSEDYCSCQYEPMQMCPSEQKGEFIDCRSAAAACKHAASTSSQHTRGTSGLMTTSQWWEWCWCSAILKNISLCGHLFRHHQPESKIYTDKVNKMGRERHKL